MTTRTASDDARTDRQYRYDDTEEAEPREPYEPPTWPPEELWRRFSVPAARRCATHRH